MNVFVVSIPNEYARKRFARHLFIWRFNLSNDDLISLTPGLKTGVNMPLFG